MEKYVWTGRHCLLPMSLYGLIHCRVRRRLHHERSGWLASVSADDALTVGGGASIESNLGNFCGRFCLVFLTAFKNWQRLLFVAPFASFWTAETSTQIDIIRPSMHSIVLFQAATSINYTKIQREKKQKTQTKRHKNDLPNSKWNFMYFISNW